MIIWHPCFCAGCQYSQSPRLIGRITAPHCALRSLKAFVHTSNRKSISLGFLTFAIIAQIPFSFFESGTFTYHWRVLLHLHAHLP